MRQTLAEVVDRVSCVVRACPSLCLPQARLGAELGVAHPLVVGTVQTTCLSLSRRRHVRAVLQAEGRDEMRPRGACFLFVEALTVCLCEPPFLLENLSDVEKV